MFDVQLEQAGFHIPKREDRKPLYNSTLDEAVRIFDDAEKRLKALSVSGPKKDVFEIITNKRAEKTSVPEFRTGGVLPEYILVMAAMRDIVNEHDVNRLVYLQNLTKMEQEALSVLVFNKVCKDHFENPDDDQQVIPVDVRLRRTLVSNRDLLSSIRFDFRVAEYTSHVFLENLLNLSPMHSHNFDYLGGSSDVLRIQNEVKFFISNYNLEPLIKEIIKKGGNADVNTDYQRIKRVKTELESNCNKDMLEDVYYSLYRLRDALFRLNDMPKRIEFYRKSGHILLDLNHLLNNKHDEDLRKPYQLPEKILVENLETAWFNGFNWDGTYYSAMDATTEEYEQDLFFKTSREVKNSMETGLKQLKASVDDYLRSKTPYTFDVFSEQTNNLLEQINNTEQKACITKKADVKELFDSFRNKVTAFREYVFYNK